MAVVNAGASDSRADNVRASYVVGVHCHRSLMPLPDMNQTQQLTVNQIPALRSLLATASGQSEERTGDGVRDPG
jgi:hypothetical protein